MQSRTQHGNPAVDPGDDMRRLKDLLQDCRGATAVEYGLILALIFLAMVAAIQGVATETSGMWNNVSTAVTKR